MARRGRKPAQEPEAPPEEPPARMATRATAAAAAQRRQTPVPEAPEPASASSSAARPSRPARSSRKRPADEDEKALPDAKRPRTRAESHRERDLGAAAVLNRTIETLDAALGVQGTGGADADQDAEMEGEEEEGGEEEPEQEEEPEEDAEGAGQSDAEESDEDLPAITEALTASRNGAQRPVGGKPSEPADEEPEQDDDQEAEEPAAGGEAEDGGRVHKQVAVVSQERIKVSSSYPELGPANRQLRRQIAKPSFQEGRGAAEDESEGEERIQIPPGRPRHRRGPSRQASRQGSHQGSRQGSRRGSRQESRRPARTAPEDEGDEDEEEEEDVRVDLEAEAGGDAAALSPPKIGRLETGSLGKILKLMARAGWMGESLWEDAIRNDQEDDSEFGSGPASEPGQQLWQHLTRLEKLIDEVPYLDSPSDENLDLSDQDSFLRSQQSSLHGLYEQILAQINAIDQILHPPDDGEPDGQDNDYKKEIPEELASSIIPLTVLVLKKAYMLGGCRQEGRGDQRRRTLLPEGRFTRTTLALIARIVGWLSRLEVIVASALGYGEGGGAQASQPPSSRVEPRSSAALKRARDKAAKEAERARNRVALRVHILKIKRDVHAASRQIRELEERERHLRTRRAQEKEAEEAEERRRERADEEFMRRWEATCRSTQDLARRPDPLRARWLRISGVGDAESELEPEPEQLLADEDTNYLLDVLRTCPPARLDLRAVAEEMRCRYEAVEETARRLKAAMRREAARRRRRPPKWAV